jgi:hypothetical protein
MLTYRFLDAFFMVLHPAIIVFNLTGWIFRKTRRWNLVLLLLTGASWFILGIWKGIGYCPLTDWHFSVLIKLGEKDLPFSYIAYLMDRILGWRLSDELTDYVTVTLFALALCCSVALNFRDIRKSRNLQSK